MTKESLYLDGLQLMNRVCVANRIGAPEVIRLNKGDRLYALATCAFYRPPGFIKIMVHKCAHLGVSGSAWSFPGYKVDRTPYGVLIHELGHHFDFFLSKQFGALFSWMVWDAAKEQALTNYVGTDSNPGTYYKEWFAEQFRLFGTNPDLLRLLRPKTHATLLRYFLPVELRPWHEVLATAPARTLAMAERLVVSSEVSA